MIGTEIKKHIIIFFTAIFLIAGIFSLAKAEIQYNEAVVNADEVAMRKEASSSSPYLVRLDKGTKLELLGTNFNAEWHKVKYKNRTGFVNRMYLDLIGTRVSDNYTGTVINCEQNVNVRKAPDKNAEKIGFANLGDNYPVVSVDIQNGYYGIDFNGTTGYVSMQYLGLSELAEGDQLSDIRVIGGTMIRSFTPDVYGYVIRADSDKIRVEAEAEPGVKISVAGTHKGQYEFDMPETGVKTVRIRVNGSVRYSLYFIRNVLTVSTYNIKRGNSRSVEMGEQIAAEQPDIMGLQEVYRCPKINEGEAVNNLLALRTKHMSYSAFAPTIQYPSTGEYGIGLLSAFELKDVEIRPLPVTDIEPRSVIRAHIEVDGKRVSVYNTHLSYDSIAIREKQFAALVAFMEEDPCPYKILFGDFNAKEYTEYDPLLKSMIAINAENTDYFGYDGEAYTYSMRIDNIFVTRNIHVWNTRLNGDKISDHRMLIAYITLD